LTGLIQSNFIPWIGYFDFIKQCDLFIFHDDLQYTKSDWRNRNRIKTPNEIRWINVPVLYKESLKTTIDQTKINYKTDWVSEHEKWLTLSYKKAKFFELIFPKYLSIVQKKYETISELNQNMIFWVMSELNIQTKTINSRQLSAIGSKTDRVIDILKKVNAKSYLSGPAAKDYLDENMFAKNNINLFYKSYSYFPYPQLHGEFVPGLSIIDLLFNCGPESNKYINSSSENTIVEQQN